MLINEFVALELHKQRVNTPERVEGNRTLAEIITEFKLYPIRRENRKARRTE
ncbi:MAG: hypothetical protein RLP44_00735 [Aggregatilineales bacterium]